MERQKMGKRLVFFFLQLPLRKNNLIAILYRISLYYILDTLPLQLKNVYYTNIYVWIQLEYLALTIWEKKKKTLV